MNTCTSSVACALLLLASGHVRGSEGADVTFSGLVNSGTCNLSVPTGPIQLPDVRTSDFSDGAPLIGSRSFAVTAQCDADVENVVFAFAGTPDPYNGTDWKNTGSAVNVALRLQTFDGSYQNQSPGQTATRQPDGSGVATLDMRAGYHWATPATVPIEGTLLSSMTVSITYD